MLSKRSKITKEYKLYDSIYLKFKDKQKVINIVREQNYSWSGKENNQEGPGECLPGVGNILSLD